MGKRPSRFGNRDDKEKTRKLSAAEQRRLDRFNALCERMAEQGYRRTELTVGIVKANVFAMVLLIPILIISFGLFLLVNRSFSFNVGYGSAMIFLVIFLVLVVVHELIHGLSWAIYAEHHFKDIEFGFMAQYLTPYCTCCVPLKKNQYIFGALMPLVILGILPIIYGIAAGSLAALLMGIMMADAAAGDIMIVWQMLRYKSSAEEIIYIDHPTQAGMVVFEK